MLTNDSFSRLSLRDYFAGLALQALIGQTTVLQNGQIKTEMIVSAAFDVAEIMITEKGKR